MFKDLRAKENPILTNLLIGSFFFFKVATGFPTGQTPLKTRLGEIHFAVENGATEIDVVINRTYALSGNWKGKLMLYQFR